MPWEHPLQVGHSRITPHQQQELLDRLDRGQAQAEKQRRAARRQLRHEARAALRQSVKRAQLPKDRRAKLAREALIGEFALPRSAQQLDAAARRWTAEGAAKRKLAEAAKECATRLEAGDPVMCEPDLSLGVPVRMRAKFASFRCLAKTGIAVRTQPNEGSKVSARRGEAMRGPSRGQVVKVDLAGTMVCTSEGLPVSRPDAVGAMTYLRLADGRGYLPQHTYGPPPAPADHPFDARKPKPRGAEHAVLSEMTVCFELLALEARSLPLGERWCTVPMLPPPPAVDPLTKDPKLAINIQPRAYGPNVFKPGELLPAVAICRTSGGGATVGTNTSGQSRQMSSVTMRDLLRPNPKLKGQAKRDQLAMQQWDKLAEEGWVYEEKSGATLHPYVVRTTSGAAETNHIRRQQRALQLGLDDTREIPDGDAAAAEGDAAAAKALPYGAPKLGAAQKPMRLVRRDPALTATAPAAVESDATATVELEETAEAAEAAEAQAALQAEAPEFKVNTPGETAEGAAKAASLNGSQRMGMSSSSFDETGSLSNTLRMRGPNAFLSRTAVLEARTQERKAELLRSYSLPMGNFFKPKPLTKETQRILARSEDLKSVFLDADAAKAWSKQQPLVPKTGKKPEWSNSERSAAFNELLKQRLLAMAAEQMRAPTAEELEKRRKKPKQVEALSDVERVAELTSCGLPSNGSRGHQIARLKDARIARALRRQSPVKAGRKIKSSAEQRRVMQGVETLRCAARILPKDIPRMRKVPRGLPGEGEMEYHPGAPRRLANGLFADDDLSYYPLDVELTTALKAAEKRLRHLMNLRRQQPKVSQAAMDLQVNDEDIAVPEVSKSDSFDGYLCQNFLAERVPCMLQGVDTLMPRMHSFVVLEHDKFVKTRQTSLGEEAWVVEEAEELLRDDVALKSRVKARAEHTARKEWDGAKDTWIASRAEKLRAKNVVSSMDEFAKAGLRMNTIKGHDASYSALEPLATIRNCEERKAQMIDMHEARYSRPWKPSKKTSKIAAQIDGGSRDGSFGTKSAEFSVAKVTDRGELLRIAAQHKAKHIERILADGRRFCVEAAAKQEDATAVPKKGDFEDQERTEEARALLRKAVALYTREARSLGGQGEVPAELLAEKSKAEELLLLAGGGREEPRPAFGGIYMSRQGALVNAVDRPLSYEQYKKPVPVGKSGKPKRPSTAAPRVPHARTFGASFGTTVPTANSQAAIANAALARPASARPASRKVGVLEPTPAVPVVQTKEQSAKQKEVAKLRKELEKKELERSSEATKLAEAETAKHKAQIKLQETTVKKLAKSLESHHKTILAATEAKDYGQISKLGDQVAAAAESLREQQEKLEQLCKDAKQAEQAASAARVQQKKAVRNPKPKSEQPKGKGLTEKQQLAVSRKKIAFLEAELAKAAKGFEASKDKSGKKPAAAKAKLKAKPKVKPKAAAKAKAKAADV